VKLYHFTCEDHGLPGIQRDGALVPQPQHLLDGIRLLWLTDLALPRDPDLLGLSKALPGSCDRLAARFTVQTRLAVPWRDFVALHRLDPDAVACLERYRTPEHWWVCGVPLRRYVLDRPVIRRLATRPAGGRPP